MLDLAKIEAGKLEIDHMRIDTGAILSESLVMLSSAANAAEVEVAVEGDRSTWPSMEGDPVKLKQVFVNLIGNAIKFTTPGGRVTIAGALHPGCLEISISDTGIGISAEHIPLVVQPFYRVGSALDSNHQGAGLGLPFAKSIVEMHGGTLVIDSKLGSGTKVTVTLPLVCAGAVANSLPNEAVNQSMLAP
jgi:signal transduction histidine kinase